MRTILWDSEMGWETKFVIAEEGSANGWQRVAAMELSKRATEKANVRRAQGEGLRVSAPRRHDEHTLTMGGDGFGRSASPVLQNTQG